MNLTIKISIISILLFAMHNNSIAQDFEEMQNRTNVVQKVRNFYSNNQLKNFSIDEWQTIYDWQNTIQTNLSNYDYGLYSKYTQSGKRYGLLRVYSDTTHKTDTLTKAVYELIHGAFDGGVIVSNENKLGMADSAGSLVIPTEYDEVSSFNKDRGFVKKSGKYAAITYSGKILTAFIFDKVTGFSDNAAKVIVNNRIGFIDRNGKYIVQPEYNQATHFFYGFSKIYYDKWETVYKTQVYQGLRTTNMDVGYNKSIPFLINKQGAKIFTGKDGDEISVTENSYAVISRNEYINGNKYYLEQVIDTTGKVIIPFDRKFNISAFTKDWIIVKNSISGYSGIIDYNGKELLKTGFYNIEPLKYDNWKLGKAYFDENTFYYFDKDCNCVEFEGIKCPEKN